MKVFLALFIFSYPLLSVDRQYFLDYVYVNANTGQSSGGHSGIRLGELVYHFQFYPDQIFHIVREPWSEFRYVYGIQENRTIKIRKISISKETFDFLLERMNEIYLIQKKELDNLVKLENDLKILESISTAGGLIHLKAASYFNSKSTTNNDYKPLLQKIHSKFGRNFILKNLNLTRKKLYQFEFYSYEVGQIPNERKIYPKTIKHFSTEYLELISLMKVYEVLLDELELNPSSFFEYSFDSTLTLTEIRLSQLSKFSEKLENEILNLFELNSTNKGYSLLVTLARYLVIKKSIVNKTNYFLDSYSKNHMLVIGEAIQNKSFLRGVETQSREKVNVLYNDFFTKEDLLEKDYNKLEDLANRHVEILNGINKLEPIRINYEQMMPSKEGDVVLDYDYSKSHLLKSLSTKVRTNKSEYELALQKKYSFNLFNKNCTTELFHSINSFFHNGTIESKERLGGVVNGNDFLVFIPVYAYYAVGEKYNTQLEMNIPSLRTMILEKNSSNGRSFIESNTLTSKYYKFNNEDSLFIFFTDDVIWQRPIYGILNLAVGVGEVIFGIGILPIDKGKRFVKGLQGVFFSGPELLFFNVRKGTFIYEGKPEWLEEEYK